MHHASATLTLNQINDKNLNKLWINTFVANATNNAVKQTFSSFLENSENTINILVREATDADSNAAGKAHALCRTSQNACQYATLTAKTAADTPQGDSKYALNHAIADAATLTAAAALESAATDAAINLPMYTADLPHDQYAPIQARANQEAIIATSRALLAARAVATRNIDAIDSTTTAAMTASATFHITLEKSIKARMSADDAEQRRKAVNDAMSSLAFNFHEMNRTQNIARTALALANRTGTTDDKLLAALANLESVCTRRKATLDRSRDLCLFSHLKDADSIRAAVTESRTDISAIDTLATNTLADFRQLAPDYQISETTHPASAAYERFTKLAAPDMATHNLDAKEADARAATTSAAASAYRNTLHAASIARAARAQANQTGTLADNLSAALAELELACIQKKYTHAQSLALLRMANSPSHDHIRCAISAMAKDSFTDIRIADDQAVKALAYFRRIAPNTKISEATYPESAAYERTRK